jgi:SWI/SNF-related matrix-associated actin-dependent regulator of chromatin subfamily A3
MITTDMGLGKTIMTLAVITTNTPSSMPFQKPNSSVCTLVVAPKTVISNWQQQIDQFIKPGELRVSVYCGDRKKRSKMIPHIQNNEVDILLVSYETLAHEYDDPWVDRKGNHMPDISDVRFHRIVLDEAHIVRSVNSKAFKAVLGIANVSEHRLALTGTSA